MICYGTVAVETEFRRGRLCHGRSSVLDNLTLDVLTLDVLNLGRIELRTY